MPETRLAGNRIRERRLLQGMRQSQLAKLVEISPSYLNLIEHNRRRIGGKLLINIAGVLGVEPSLLAEGAEAALIERLRRAAAEADEEGAELAQVEDFAGRFPGWARLVAAQGRRIAALERAVASLNDRLTHDPHLAATLHEVLDTATSIRSTAGILVDTKEIEPEWRERFHRNINEDALRLADGARSLAGFLDAEDAGENEPGSPQDELEAFWSAHSGHFQALEEVKTVEIPEALVAGASQLVSASAQVQARAALDRYRRDADLMPLPEVLGVLEEAGPNPLILSERFGVDLGAAMRRIASVPELEAGLVICDGSGTITFRQPVEGFVLPRYGAACPLWPLFRALSRPLVPLFERLHQPGRRDGRVQERAFVTYAVAQPRSAPGLNRDPLYEAHMLILPVNGPLQAAEGETGGEGNGIAVGANCRICTARNCQARREPSIMTGGV
ncbi:helix-turn-helix domain-containing protein [Rhodobacteraceae bacterium D3-12]|nr:helix-turn-helix domain-containing protein [Rhodobacteraceae bacterium D3-12]